MASISAGLGEVIRGLDDELSLLQTFMLIGLLVGWRLGSQMAGWKRYMFWGLVGVSFIFLSTGHLWLPGAAALRSGALYGTKYLGVLLTYIGKEIPAEIIPSIAPLNLSWSQFSVGSSNHWREISEWVEYLLIGNPSFKSGAVIFIWSVVLWVMSIHSAWVLRVHNSVLLSVLPGGILMTTAMAFARW